jgi:hypothetical protein
LKIKGRGQFAVLSGAVAGRRGASLVLSKERRRLHKSSVFCRQGSVNTWSVRQSRACTAPLITSKTFASLNFQSSKAAPREPKGNPSFCILQEKRYISLGTIQRLCKQTSSSKCSIASFFQKAQDKLPKQEKAALGGNHVAQRSANHAAIIHLLLPQILEVRISIASPQYTPHSHDLGRPSAHVSALCE